MAILTGELQLYRSAVVNDASSNGGRMSANVMISGVVGNMFPSINDAERASGSLKYRKVFCKVDNAANLTLFTPRLYMDMVTPGEDMITFFPATQIDTQAGLTGSERQYGAGVLSTASLVGATSISVQVENGTIPVFASGDKVLVTNKTNLADTGGTAEVVQLSATPSVVADVVTMTFTPGLAFAYAAGGVTRVSALFLPVDDVLVDISDLSETSVAGVINEANILGNNKGSIEQTWLCTFTSPTAFNVVGDTVGAVGSGTTGSGAAPNNPAFGAPYFTMQSAGFTGAWLSGETITFKTHPAAVPVWFKRIVPVGAAPLANNRARFVFAGESAA